jgi:flagellar basal body rod protein FlgG
MKCWLRLSLWELFLITTLAAGVAYAWSNARRPPVVERTDRELDIALLGDGYFCVCSDLFDGFDFAYTRRGRFELDAARQIVVESAAERLEDELILSPSICIPESAGEVRISPTGLVECVDKDTQEIEAFGRIQITRFARPEELEEVMPGLYRQTAASGRAQDMELSEDGRDFIKQGWIERTPPRFGPSTIAVMLALGIAVMAGGRVVGFRRRGICSPDG